MKRLLFAASAVCCLALAHQAAAQSAIDSLDTTYLNQMIEADADRDSCGGNGRTSLLNASVEQGLGVVSNKALSGYLDGIMRKLLAASPHTDCSVTVYVTPHDAAQAVALADGGVLVAIGFLRNLKNEDEVAALLAHELSHILRDHHSTDAFAESQDGFLKGLETANASDGMLLGLVDPNLQQAADAAVSVGDAMYNISESMIAPAWTVKQEDEADLLGTDLLVAAGYNPRAMAAVMDIIEAQEENAAAVETQRDELYKQRVQGTLVSAFVETDANNISSIVGALANVTSALVSGSDKKTHRPAAERKTSVNAYIKKFHRKHRRRAYKDEAWTAQLNAGDSGTMFARYRKAATARRVVFTGGDLNAAVRDVNASVAGAFSSHSYPRIAQSEVRLKKGDRNAAIASLEKVMKRPEAPWQVYRSYIDLQLGAGNKREAYQALLTADEKFGEPIGIAPYAIEVSRTLKDPEMVSLYMERCKASGSREHIKICENAAGVKSGGGSSGGSGIGGFLGGIIGGSSSGSSSGSGFSLPFGGSSSGSSSDSENSDNND
ncbi:MAG: M48 family metalloprotease [Alphaproteobacteria bacterium]|nr:M48 family metalloprotease [Alphaproteobacteria bacterium]